MCPEVNNPIVDQAYIVSYYVIVTRDTAMLVITCFFLRRVVSDRRTIADLKSLSDGQRETHIYLYEFSSVLLSVLPY